MYQDTRRYYIFSLTALLSISCSYAQTDGVTNSDDLHSQESFVQYSTEGGTVIVAKPLKKAPVYNPVFEDYVHVVVACTLALLLATLLGLFIRHYGLTLPALGRPGDRSNSNRGPAGDSDDPQQNASRRGLVGIGIDKWEKGGLELGGGIDDSDLPERPAAVHLKWG
jgi:hypothetical protein